jgi:hypothetical protein
MHSATEQIPYGGSHFRLLEALQEFVFAQRAQSVMISGSSIFCVRPHGESM